MRTDGGADIGTAKELHLGMTGNSLDTGAGSEFKASKIHFLYDLLASH